MSLRPEVSIRGLIMSWYLRLSQEFAQAKASLAKLEVSGVDDGLLEQALDLTLDLEAGLEVLQQTLLTEDDKVRTFDDCLEVAREEEPEEPAAHEDRLQNYLVNRQLVSWRVVALRLMFEDTKTLMLARGAYGFDFSTALGDSFKIGEASGE